MVFNGYRRISTCLVIPIRSITFFYQYKELFPDIGNQGINLSDQYTQLHNFVPLIKEFRSIRTHNLYQNPLLFKALLMNIQQDSKLLCRQLDKLFVDVKHGYAISNDVKINQLASKFDAVHSHVSSNSECRFI